MDNLNELFIVKCPYDECGVFIEILAINCAIFRCGIYKNTYQQLNPHLPENECKLLKSQDLILGCGQPFKLINKIATKCDYI